MAAAKKRGLGRGLDTLLGAEVKSVRSGQKNTGGITELSVEALKAGRYQPRSKMELERLQELADSIRQQGVINPIVVRPSGVNKYEIIAGERRFRASKMAGLKTVPVIIRKVDDKNALAMALIENMQREDLNAVEEAIGVQRLIDEFGYTHEKAAEAIGRSRSATTNLLRLLKLAKPVQEMLMDAKLEMGHARALLSLPGAEQIEMANEVVAKGLSVRDVERCVEKKQTPEKKQVKRKEAKKSRDDLILEEKLSDALGAPVRVDYLKRGKGQVVIDFSSLDDLDAIIAKLLPEH